MTFMIPQEMFITLQITDCNVDLQQERALYLSLKYEFVTPLTSLVVVKPDSKEKGDFDDADEMAENKIKFRY